MKVNGVARWIEAGRKIGLLLLLPAVCAAEYHEVEDIKPFGLIDVTGHVRVGYLFDDRQRDSSSDRVFDQQANWEEEIFVLTRSFIYHPGFLNMDLGGGPILVQQQFDSNFDAASNNDVLFNFVGRLNVLEIKKYPVSVYYERSHPSVTTSRAGRFLVQNDVYGVRGHLSGLLTKRTSARYAITRQQSNGEGFGSVVDSAIESKSFSFETRYRKSDRLVLQLDQLDQESASGSAGLPIVQSTLEQRIAEIRADNVFGATDQVRVSQVLRHLQQQNETVSESTLDDVSYDGNVHWQYRAGAHSYLNIRDASSDRQSSRMESTDVELGTAAQVSDTVFARGAVAYGSVDQTGFQRERGSVNGSAKYSRETGFGNIGIAGSVRAERTDQVSTEDEVAVFDEPLLLVGTTPTDLRNDFVVPGSVVVRNFDKTQIYVEGLDYRLVTIGSVTSVQRLVNSSITDGETVLVDYSYSTSGTAEFDTLGSGVVLSAGFLETFTAHIRYSWQDTEIRQGILTNPLNDGEIIEFGLGTTNQFLDGWTLDAQYRHILQKTEVSPFESDLLSVNVTTSLRGTLALSFGYGLSEIDYEFSNEDVSQVTYRVGLRGRMFRRTHFAYDASLLDDTGGTLPRTQIRHRLNFQWNYRQMRFELRGTMTEDTLGVSERRNVQVTAQITRVF